MTVIRRTAGLWRHPAGIWRRPAGLWRLLQRKFIIKFSRPLAAPSNIIHPNVPQGSFRTSSSGSFKHPPLQQQRAQDKLSRRLRQRKFVDKFSRPLAALLQRWLCQHKFRSVRVQQQRQQQHHRHLLLQHGSDQQIVCARVQHV